MVASDDGHTVKGPILRMRVGEALSVATSLSCWDYQARPGACWIRCHRWRGMVRGRVTLGWLAHPWRRRISPSVGSGQQSSRD